MARLFLIGNGYDISRRGDTKYKDFKKWLVKEFLQKDFCNVFINGDINYSFFNRGSTSSIKLLKKLVVTSNEEEKAKFDSLVQGEQMNEDFYRTGITIAILFKSMEILKDEENWSNFEENLAHLPLKKIISEYKKHNLENSVSFNSSIGSPVSHETEIVCIDVIQHLFSQWISSLKNLSIPKRAFEKKIITNIQKNDSFIIFNYTQTIEKMFNNYDPAIFCHIHGTQADENTIVVGHNCKEKSKGTPLDSENDYVNESYAMLYKNPERVIKNNQSIWSRLSSEEELEIFEFGWSCSDVDADYVSKIVEIIKNNRISYKLYLNNFNGEGENKKKKWLEHGLPESLGTINFYVEAKNNSIVFSD